MSKRVDVFKNTNKILRELKKYGSSNMVVKRMSKGEAIKNNMVNLLDLGIRIPVYNTSKLGAVQYKLPDDIYVDRSTAATINKLNEQLRDLTDVTDTKFTQFRQGSGKVIKTVVRGQSPAFVTAQRLDMLKPDEIRSVLKLQGVNNINLPGSSFTESVYMQDDDVIRALSNVKITATSYQLIGALVRKQSLDLDRSFRQENKVLAQVAGDILLGEMMAKNNKNKSSVLYNSKFDIDVLPENYIAYAIYTATKQLEKTQTREERETIRQEENARRRALNIVELTIEELESLRKKYNMSVLSYVIREEGKAQKEQYINMLLQLFGTRLTNGTGMAVNRRINTRAGDRIEDTIYIEIQNSNLKRLINIINKMTGAQFIRAINNQSGISLWQLPGLVRGMQRQFKSKNRQTVGDEDQDYDLDVFELLVSDPKQYEAFNNLLGDMAEHFLSYM